MNEFVNWIGGGGRRRRRTWGGRKTTGSVRVTRPGLEWLASEAKGERREAPSQMAVLMLLLLSPTSRR